MSETVLSFGDALALVLHHAQNLRAGCALETVTLADAPGRVLAQALHADRDQPPFARSTRDGFALRSSDVDGKTELQVVGLVRAGDAWRGPELNAFESIEIMTGAPLPKGADAVLMLEHTTLDESSRTLGIAERRTLAVGQNVVQQGAEARAGDLLVDAGRRIDAAVIALAASVGAARLSVFAKPSVAIIATGDELVALDAQLEPWQIRNSNAYSLAALVTKAGGQPARLSTARDTLQDVQARLAEARASDLIVLSGGVSKGKYDLVEEALTEAGAEFFFTGAMIQPGRPVVFGRLPASNGTAAQYFFGLPGNPVSTQVTFALFVAPLLRALGGEKSTAPQFLQATLSEDVRGGAKVMRFLPATLSGSWKGANVRVNGWQGSGDLAANSRANCYVVLPCDVASFTAGETVRVLLR